MTELPKPYVDHVNLVMDASNFARGNDSGVASIKRLENAFIAVNEALDGRKHELLIVADSNLHKKFPISEKSAYSTFKDSHHLTTVATGQEADFRVLNWAVDCFKEHGEYAIVLTQDGYWQEKFSKYHHWLYEKNAARMFGGGTIGVEQKWYLEERHMGPNGQLRDIPEGRSLSDFLDQRFPTPRSIARAVGFNTESLMSLVEESELGVVETTILAEDVARSFTNFLTSVQRFVKAVAEIPVANGIETAGLIRWLDDANFEYFIRGGKAFVDAETEMQICLWSESVSGTIGRYWLQKAIVAKDSQEITLALSRLASGDDLAAIKVGSLSKQMLDNGRISDWSLIGGLSNRDADWLVELSREAGLHLDLDLIPAKFQDQLPDSLRLLKLARNLEGQMDDELVVDYFDLLYSVATKSSYEIADISSDGSFQNVSQLLISHFTSRKSQLSHSTWSQVAAILELLCPNCDIAFIANFAAGNLEQVLLDETGCSLKTSNYLRKRFFEEYLDAPWLTAGVFREIAKTPDDARALINGDLSPLLGNSKFREIAKNSGSEVLGFATPVDVLAGSLIVESMLSTAVEELRTLTLAMSKVLKLDKETIDEY